MPVGEVADGSAPRATSPTLSIRRLAFSSRIAFAAMVGSLVPICLANRCDLTPVL